MIIHVPTIIESAQSAARDESHVNRAQLGRGVFIFSTVLVVLEGVDRIRRGWQSSCEKREKHVITM